MGAIQGKKLEPVVCPLCNGFSTKRLTNFEKHLNDEHSTTSQKLWDKLNGGPRKCQCQCGTETLWNGWKVGYSAFKIGHNASIYSSFTKEVAEKIAEQRAAALRGRPTWSKGLTKETDERVKKRSEAISVGVKESFANGRIAWSKGLTKETDERIAAAAITAKEAYASGTRTQWHAGLSAKTDERISKKNSELKQKYLNGDLTQWHAGKTVADDPRIGKFWAARDPVAEYSHIRFTNEEIEKQLENNVSLSLERIDSYRNDRKPALHVRCRTCNWTSKVALIFARADRCPICSPTGSAGQNEIADWLQSLGIKIGRNVAGIIGRQELDIYSLQHKLAIEFNGLYFHNVASGKDARYHQTKTERCQKLGISLFHIFEDEWYNKPEIIKSIISHRLKLSKNKVHARKCSIVELSIQERRDFFTTNHIDGDTNALFSYGLKYHNQIVAAVSVRKPLHSEANTLEIARCCTALNTSIAGFVGKLVSSVKKEARARNYSNLITYVDTRFGGTGIAYEAAGFTKTGTTPPRFWWTDNHTRFNRFKVRADSSRGLSEAQVAEEYGVVRIYGCNNSVYRMTL